MTLSFSTHIDGKPTCFVEKIWWGIFDVYGHLYFDYFSKELNHRGISMTESMPPKIHTIRADPKNRWRAGMNIHFVIHNRTPNRFQFAPVLPCISVQEIEIVNDSEIEQGKKIIVDGKHLTNCHQLVMNDGFDSIDDFWNYFGDYFRGKIIHWTDHQY